MSLITSKASVMLEDEQNSQQQNFARGNPAIHKIRVVQKTSNNDLMAVQDQSLSFQSQKNTQIYQLIPQSTQNFQ